MSQQFFFSICIHVLAPISSIPVHGVCRLSVLCHECHDKFLPFTTVVAHVIGTHTEGNGKFIDDEIDYPFCFLVRLFTSTPLDV